MGTRLRERRTAAHGELRGQQGPVCQRRELSESPPPYKIDTAEVFLFAFPFLNSMQVSVLLSTHPLFRNQVTIH